MASKYKSVLVGLDAGASRAGAPANLQTLQKPTMAYHVGSLADMISASGSKEKKKKKTRKTEAGGGGAKIEFQKVERTTVSSIKKGSKKRRFDEKGVDNSRKMIKKKVTWDADIDKPNKKAKKEVIADSGTADSGTADSGTADSGTADPSPAATTRKKLTTGAQKRIEMKGLPKPKVVTPRIPPDPERERRTIYVGNLCLKTTKSNLKKMFRKFGLVDTVRIRGAPVADPRTPKKVAIIKSEFHPERTTFHAYVRFENELSAQKALQMNGKTYRDHVLRVDLVAKAVSGGVHNAKKAIFVGNIKFTLEEDDLRRVFQSCGEIESVRMVRDAKTGMGKGFGFVNFVDSESVELALKLDGEELEKRPIRVTRCDANATPKKRVEPTNGVVKSAKKKKKLEKKTDEDGTEFKGQEIDGKTKKKKKKKNLSEQKKKQMLNKLEVNPKHTRTAKKQKKPRKPKPSAE